MLARRADPVRGSAVTPVLAFVSWPCIYLVMGGNAVSSALTAGPALSACEDPVPGARRPWWAFWRSPEGQPPWARPVLLGIAAVAALLYAWNITSAGFSPFYSVAVKSMSESWKAFFYGAFDPKATITIDKLAGSFLPQALSARIFGYYAWSLALPQVIEGVISVLVMYRVVRRWAGVIPGLLAAGIFALTPIAASMFGHSMEDGGLTVCLVLAADSYQRAVMTARLRSLIWAGVWVGLGFQAKMMQAWIILPALVIAYLLAAPAGLGRRLWHLGVAGLVMLAVSLSWIALYTFTPASDRPYVDGSTNNSALAMVFGYNGLERFGISVPGSVQSAFTVDSGRGARGGDFPFPDRGTGGRGFPGGGDFPGGGRDFPGGGGGFSGGGSPAPTTGSAPGSGSASASETQGEPVETRFGDINAGGFLGASGGWTKLVSTRFGPQIGWLYPLALLTLILGLAWRGRARRTDQVRAGLVMWGVWLLTFAAVYSKMSNIPHTAYMASLAPPLAALSGAGIVLFWRWYQSSNWLWWVAPLAVAAELAWAAYLWRTYPGFLPWARWAAIAAGAAAILALLLARVSRRVRARIAGAALAAGFAAVLAAPATWSASVLDVRYAGTSLDASAGPAGLDSGFGTPGGFRPNSGAEEALGRRYREDFGAAPAGGAAGPGLFSTGTTLSAGEQQLYAYLMAHRDGAGYLMAVQSWSQAGTYITATGQEVLPMGGFSGSVPEPTLARVKQLVASGQLRFFLLGAGGGFGGGFGPGTGAGGSEVQQIASWVESSCAVVPATAYGASAGPATGGSSLYECTARD
jgi:4-amino-4-deoxy-L-arabinose transferase-like glycosyltransferase